MSEGASANSNESDTDVTSLYHKVKPRSDTATSFITTLVTTTFFITTFVITTFVINIFYNETSIIIWLENMLKMIIITNVVIKKSRYPWK